MKDPVPLSRLPQKTINLMFEKTAENDPFYARVVQNFYKDATEHDFTFCELPKTFDAYFTQVEVSVRRNYEEALRLGYRMSRFDFNTYLADVRDIWLSTPAPQAEDFPDDVRQGQVALIKDPPSWTPYHDYPYFGIFKDEKLVAYAACLISGELCNINAIYAHTQYRDDGIIPLLIIDITRVLIESYSDVKYYSYGTFHGASETIQQFKRKFLFNPHHVTWKLGTG